MLIHLSNQKKKGNADAPLLEFSISTFSTNHAQESTDSPSLSCSRVTDTNGPTSVVDHSNVCTPPILNASSLSRSCRLLVTPSCPSSVTYTCLASVPALSTSPVCVVMRYVVIREDCRSSLRSASGMRTSESCRVFRFRASGGLPRKFASISIACFRAGIRFGAAGAAPAATGNRLRVRTIRFGLTAALYPTCLNAIRPTATYV
mmetsp:Transcript_30142/g.90313  ORF Transcript_30142/g.90313 Transcript_30142/m.90313 type:complete len:204 (+) Transcript_30142:6616-7227(+)